MGVRYVSDRLSDLYRLRDRLNLEIRAEEAKCQDVVTHATLATSPIQTTARPARALPSRRPVPAHIVRAWARSEGLDVGARGRIHADVWDAYMKAHG